MKDKLQNSRLTFSNNDIKTILNCLNSWIKIDNETYGGSGVKPVQDIVDFIKLKTLKYKNIYTLNMNCSQLSYIHNIVAEDFLQIKSISKKESLNVCENIEKIMECNYKLTTDDILYPVIKWKYK